MKRVLLVKIKGYDGGAGENSIHGIAPGACSNLKNPGRWEKHSTSEIHKDFARKCKDVCKGRTLQPQACKPTTTLNHKWKRFSYHWQSPTESRPLYASKLMPTDCERSVCHSEVDLTFSNDVGSSRKYDVLTFLNK